MGFADVMFLRGLFILIFVSGVLKGGGGVGRGTTICQTIDCTKCKEGHQVWLLLTKFHWCTPYGTISYYYL